ncbi:fasciclin domain-containing protein [Lacinutrix sp. 5H-3-7-4]|uniref:fasciclin domain-containing protein n=1 Tax=Lacinutrix sp. (strain 5H-3-7-4) TaxID=983544 RepID=UPI00020A390A|nr:fasciclin domain-containing protein [Lacinutrix sp. 5H-3-7-4]AEH00004.1 beta-Ig-H3/fasciclin [Lacinutrix sp. 5H-3-7-4]
MKTIQKLSLLVLALITISACSNDDDATPQTNQETTLNIVETAQANAELSLLVEAVIQTGLTDALSASGERTVFAPNNTAFTAFLNTNGFDSLAEVPNDILTQVLLNHVITDNNITSSVLIGNRGYVNTLATGPNDTNLSLYYNGMNGVMLNGASTVTTANIETTNGIVHVVDAVIGLPTIATFATSNPDLSSLVAALQLADTGTPTVPYIETVSNSQTGPFTVFAPTNDAFTALLEELELNSLEDVDAATADAILTYHIVNNANVQSSQLSSGTVTTLGGDITADASAFTLTDANNRVSAIITTLVDIQATNGVVHAIDTVLLPPQ